MAQRWPHTLWFSLQSDSLHGRPYYWLHVQIAAGSLLCRENCQGVTILSAKGIEGLYRQGQNEFTLVHSLQ